MGDVALTDGNACVDLSIRDLMTFDHRGGVRVSGMAAECDAGVSQRSECAIAFAASGGYA
jgi:hypothetical protein